MAIKMEKKNKLFLLIMSKIAKTFSYSLLKLLADRKRKICFV